MGRAQLGSGGLGVVQQVVFPAGSGVRGELGRAVGQGGQTGGSLEGWEGSIADSLLCWSLVGARGEEVHRAGGISAALGGL